MISGLPVFGGQKLHQADEQGISCLCRFHTSYLTSDMDATTICFQPQKRLTPLLSNFGLCVIRVINGECRGSCVDRKLVGDICLAWPITFLTCTCQIKSHWLEYAY